MSQVGRLRLVGRGTFSEVYEYRTARGRVDVRKYNSIAEVHLREVRAMRALHCVGGQCQNLIELIVCLLIHSTYILINF